MANAGTVRSSRLVILCLAAGLWAFSFGASAELASVWLKRAGYAYTVVGLNTSVYYLGIALAAGFVPSLMRCWGRSSLAAGMIISGISVLLFPWGGGLTGWFILRAVNGIAGAMSLIPLETLVNRTSPPERRSRNFGYYAVSVALGMAVGTWLGLQLDARSPRLAFLVGGGVTLVGTASLIWLPDYRGLSEPIHERTPLGFIQNFFSFGSAWSQGFLEGGMVSQLPIYLLAVGFGEEAVGELLGGLMIGVIAVQLPVAWLADRLGRTRILMSCYAIALAGLIWLWCSGGAAGLSIALFLVGACSGAFYPLGLAILGERLPASGLARASAWYLAINCVGSITGPLVAGSAMDHVNGEALFLTGAAALMLVLAAWAGCRFLTWRPRRAVSQTLEQRQAA